MVSKEAKEVYDELIEVYRKHEGLTIEAGRKTAMKERNSPLDVHLDVPLRSRWGRLQARAFYALLDGRGEARGDEIGRYCFDGPRTPLQVHSQGRAAKSIGARPTRRVGKDWIWRLENAGRLPKPK